MGGKKGVADLVTGKQVEGLIGVKLGKAPSDNRNAVIQAGQQHVEQTADPRPVRRRPQAVVGLWQEVLRQLHSRQVPEQDTVRVDNALRRALGAAGKDDQGSVFRAGCVGEELIFCGIKRSRSS